MIQEKRFRRYFLRCFVAFILWGMLIIALLIFLRRGRSALDGWVYVVGALLILLLYVFVIEKLIGRIKSPAPKAANRMRYFMFLLYAQIAFVIIISIIPLTTNFQYFPGKTSTLLFKTFFAGSIPLFLLMGYTIFRYHQSLIQIALQGKDPYASR